MFASDARYGTHPIAVSNETRKADATRSTIFDARIKIVRTGTTRIIASFLALCDVTNREIFFLPGIANQTRESFSGCNECERTVAEKKRQSDEGKNCEMHRGP